MSAIIIPYEDKYLDAIKEIFFESSSKKEFKDEREKEMFFYKYVGLYLKHCPDLALVAVTDRVLGYILASPVSDGAEINSIQPHLKIFHNEFKNYPAHLHINCHFESRGLGVGKMLIASLEERLKRRKIPGLHIMTAPGAANKKFYEKLGFDHEIIKYFQGSPILFMGKTLGDE